MTETPAVDSHVKIMASIGYVCVQWARLEYFILGVIGAIEHQHLEKVEIIYGGLDILPRLSMAINLARHAKAPQSMVARIDKVRGKLQSGMADKRNQVVHGAHGNLEIDGVTLTMARWKGDRKSQRVTVMDIYNLGQEIYALAAECLAVIDEINAWKVRMINKEEHRLINSLSKLTE